jgi:hypothetical protein
MRLAGFQSVFLGIENPDTEALKSFNKKQNIKVDLTNTVAVLQANGIEVFGGFILGSDEDTPSTAERIVAFVKGAKIFTAMTGLLTPTPFTPLWHGCAREGRLRLAEYSGNNTDDTVQFEPALMTTTELHEANRGIAARLFTAPETYRRALESVAAVQHHIFSGGRFNPRHLKAAAASIWGQGIRRLDWSYFQLLRTALRLDRRLRRTHRGEARELARLLRGRSTHDTSSWGLDPERLLRLAALARDYAVRNRPELNVADIVEWFGALGNRIRLNQLTQHDLRMIAENALANLRLQARQYRFPGVKLRKAFEAAIRGWHYQRVMYRELR